MAIPDIAWRLQVIEGLVRILTISPPAVRLSKPRVCQRLHETGVEFRALQVISERAPKALLAKWAKYLLLSFDPSQRVAMNGIRLGRERYK